MPKLEDDLSYAGVFKLKRRRVTVFPAQSICLTRVSHARVENLARRLGNMVMVEIETGGRNC